MTVCPFLYLTFFYFPLNTKKRVVQFGFLFSLLLLLQRLMFLAHFLSPFHVTTFCYRGNPWLWAKQHKAVEEFRRMGLCQRTDNVCSQACQVL